MPADSTAIADLRHLYALSDDARSLLFTDARTAYRFSDEPVDADQLRAIWELCKWPPTANNANPMRILYLHSAAAKERLLPLLTPPNRPKSASAAAVAVLAVDSQFDEHVPYLSPTPPGMKEMLAAAPAMRDAMGLFNSALQAAYFLLAVRATGLVAGPMKGFNAPAVDEEFFPDGRWRSLLVVNIGKPADDAHTERLPRLEYDQVVRLI
jgi:3-hydroxypropanoate dehydrogenase